MEQMWEPSTVVTKLQQNRIGHLKALVWHCLGAVADWNPDYKVETQSAGGQNPIWILPPSLVQSRHWRTVLWSCCVLIQSLLKPKTQQTAVFVPLSHWNSLKLNFMSFFCFSATENLNLCSFSWLMWFIYQNISEILIYVFAWSDCRDEI